MPLSYGNKEIQNYVAKFDNKHLKQLKHLKIVTNSDPLLVSDPVDFLELYCSQPGLFFEHIWLSHLTLTH